MAYSDDRAYAGFKYRIYPNGEQSKKIMQTAGCCRFIYNHFLEEALAVYEEKEYFPFAKYHIAALPALKEEHPFLKEVDNGALVSAIYQLADAEKRYQNGDEWGKPRKKHRSSGGSFKVPAPRLNGAYLYVPGYGNIKYVESRPPESNIRFGTISVTPSGKFYISLTCAFYPKAKKMTGAAVGVDLGIEEFAITSDGENFPNEHAYSKELKRLKRLNRAYSRKLEAAKNAAPGTAKGSNLTENRLRIARLFEHVKNQMRDSIQKATTKLVEQYDIIFIEDIDVSKIRENRDYSRQMMDVLFYEFRRELDYKAKWYGKKLHVVQNEDGPAVLPHPATVEGAKRLLEEGLKQLNR